MNYLSLPELVTSAVNKLQLHQQGECCKDYAYNSARGCRGSKGAGVGVRERRKRSGRGVICKRQSFIPKELQNNQSTQEEPPRNRGLSW
ncbi:hypothetical protein E2C01_022624 [Portunus trituberculatus]|uniref:Uncharacterized protein n=1 Tax=Portunus trituberculatus TaxID=210409 RepID=A0A5B7E9D5_PORTR|nr:hypothetical protein [Portunus trituberculatus]